MEELLEGMLGMDEKMKAIYMYMAYETEGVKGLYSNMKDKEKARKDTKKNLKKEYNDLYFECGYLSTKLDYLSMELSMKPLVNKKEDRLKLADMLEEVAEELRNI